MARSAQTAAQNASNTYSGNAASALTNYNADAANTNDAINALGATNPYTSKSYLQNQNILTSGAMNAENTQARQQLQDTALRTGTNTAALGNTVAANARAGQRQMDDYTAGAANQNEDKYLQLQQGLIGDRQNLANSQAGLYGTSAGAQGTANQDLVTLNGQQEQMWGSLLQGAGGAAGSVFQGKG